jgi:regulator of sigma E protease
MNTAILSGIIFVVVFAGIIFLHEIGHFSVARLLKIDVEEFGFGFPPRILRLFRGRGSIKISGKSFILPFNFKLPVDSKSIQDQHVRVEILSKREKKFIQSLSMVSKEKGSQEIVPEISTQGNLEIIDGIVNEIHPGTEFTLNWIPLGGFNKVRGEEDPNVPGGLASASPWKRIAVFLAGASMNLLTAVLVYTFLFIQIGVPDRHTAVIAYVEDQSPAAQAGLQAGDIVLSAGGTHITGYQTLTTIIHQNLDASLPLVILRQGKVVEISITPRSKYPADQGPMGVGIGQPLLPVNSWMQTISPALSATWQDITSLLSLPGRIIAGTISPQAAQFGGPRSVWNLFQQAVSRDVNSRIAPSIGSNPQPTNYTLLTIISLTITVAVANLLPIPALDGGHIFMVLPELLLRRKIPAKYQVMLNGIGFIILVTLLGFFYIKDFINPVNITLP